MGIIFVPQKNLYGGSSNGGGEIFSNSATLKKLSTDASGNLTFNGKAVGTSSIETAYNLTITNQQITQKFIELPEDCDTSRIITLSLNGLALERGEFWEVIEKDAPEKDLIAWNGLELENYAQVGDKILISYYKN